MCSEWRVGVVGGGEFHEVRAWVVHVEAVRGSQTFALPMCCVVLCGHWGRACAYEGRRGAAASLMKDVMATGVSSSAWSDCFWVPFHTCRQPPVNLCAGPANMLVGMACTCLELAVLIGHDQAPVPVPE